MGENKVVRTNAEARITLNGNLVAATVPDLRTELKQLLSDGVTSLVIDLSNVTMVDSMGIGCLVAAHNSLKKNNGELAVTNASEDVFDLFTSMRLNHHFRVTGTGSERTE